MTTNSGLRDSAPRLIAEFFVIVVGVLVALAADQWVQDRQDRGLEAEYLDRLRADAGYDRDEIIFVGDVSRAGLTAIDSLLAPGFVDRAAAGELVNAALLAASARQIDLSRGTWEELVASGRIALIQDAEVRLALADYDRFSREIAGFWDYTDNGLWRWIMARVPSELHDTWDRVCNAAATTSERPSLRQATSECDLDVDPETIMDIRRGIQSPEAVGELRLQRTRFQGLATITDALLMNVERLARVLDDAG